MIVDYCNVMGGEGGGIGGFVGRVGLLFALAGSTLFRRQRRGREGRRKVKSRQRVVRVLRIAKKKVERKDAIDSQKEEEITSSTQLELATEDVAGHTEPASFGAPSDHRHSE